MKLFIEPTRVTPYIAYNPSENVLHFKGRSSPENPIEFFKPVYDFFNQFENSNKSVLSVNVCLEYFNTSSTKVLFNIFKTMNAIQDKTGKVMIVNWFFEEGDDDMLEIGEDFSDALDIQFNMSEICEDNYAMVATKAA